MHSFAYVSPRSAAEALAALSAPNAVPLGGGTDLLVTIKERLVHPDLLVDLRRIPNARAISTLTDGTLRIGSAARIADIAVHPLIREQFSTLAEAARLVGLGDDDLEEIHSLFDTGRLTHPYDSVNVDINKRIRRLVDK